MNLFSTRRWGNFPLLGGARRSSLWPQVRKAHLVLQPVCQACGVADHLQVHHIEPFHVAPGRELDPTNLLTLCEKPGHDCHFVFGHFHNWSKYNPTVVADVAQYLAAAKAAP